MGRGEGEGGGGIRALPSLEGSLAQTCVDRLHRSSPHLHPRPTLHSPREATLAETEKGGHG